MHFSNKIVLLFFTGILSSCSYVLDTLHPVSPASDAASNGSQSIAPAEIYFASIQSSILEPSCYACHSAAAGNKGGVNLETYANVKAQLADVQADVDSGDMPQSGPEVSASLKAVLDQWIANGAPESASSGSTNTTNGTTSTPVASPTPVATNPTPTPAPAPQPSITTYQTVNSQIFQPYCFSCHSAAGGNRAGVNLETYANVMKNISGVKSTINSGSMPRGTTLTSAQKNLVLAWIAAGAPQTAPTTKASLEQADQEMMRKAYVDFMTEPQQ